MRGELRDSCKACRPEQVFTQFRHRILHAAGTALRLFRPTPASVMTNCWVCMFLLCLVLPDAGVAQGVAPAGSYLNSAKNLRYYQGLRDRELYELIEMLCQRELSRAGLSRDAQVFYQIEMAKTFASHAQVIPIDEASELWEQVFEMLSPAPIRPYESSNSLLAVEQGLLRAQQADQTFWIAIAESGNDALKKQFLKTARQATSELATAQQTVSQYLKKPSSKKPSSKKPVAGNKADALAARFTEDRLAEIQINRIRLYVQQAELEQQDASARSVAVQQARNIALPIAKRSSHGFREQTARLLLLTASRIQKEESEILRHYQNLNRAGNDLQIRHQAVAQYARFLLAEKQDTEAADLIQKHGREIGSLSAELEGLRLQAIMKMAITVRKTGEKRLADELENEVELQLTRLEQRGESYHTWLVRRLQQQHKTELRFGVQVTPKLLLARESTRRQNWPAAQAEYATAIKLALQESRWEIAIELAKEITAVDFQIQDYVHASRELKSVWEASPHFPEMESIHILWVYALGRNYTAKPTQEKLTAYLEALQDHRKTYADRATMGEATWLLAELQFVRLQVTRALDLYQAILQTHSRYLAAQLRIGQCYQWIIQRVRDLEQPTLPWKNRAIEFAQKTFGLLTITRINKPEQAELVLMASRILLDAHAHQAVPLHKRIPELLAVCQAAVNDRQLDAQTQASWRKVYQSTRALQGILLASQGNVDEARRLFAADKDLVTTAGDRLFIARQLAASQGASPRIRLILSELLLQVTAPLEASPEELKNLTSQQVIEYLELRSEAFAATGQTTKAVALYEKLVAKKSRSQKYVIRLGELLEECNNREHWGKAVKLWEGQVRLEKQGTETWLEARYHLANANLQLSNVEEARKIIQVTMLLYSGVGSQDLQTRYKKLAAQLQIPSSK